MKTVAFYTLGCKVNQYDAQAMKESFVRAGYKTRPFGEPVDVNVIVTCVVTAAGEQKSRQMLHRVLREQPDSQVIAAGCLAQKDADKLKDLGVRLIIGNQHRERVVNLLHEALHDNAQICAVEDVRSIPFEELTISHQDGRTRAVMKIQEGCDRFCAYCIIPHVRGGIRSRTPDAIHAEAKRLVAAGYQEIVLTGIHLTSYGKDLDGPRLMDAIRAAAVPGLPRLRLGSLEPVIATQDFVDELAEIPSICPQFHLSLQSGCDSVLYRMRRRYTADEYRAAVATLRRHFPGCAITTDIITGFPGETEEEHRQSLAFVREIGFARTHVFPYSAREGTLAATMPHQVPLRVREQRAAQMIAQGRQSALAFMQEGVGQAAQVLFEEEEANGACGYTGTYLEVFCPGARPGDIRSVRLTHIENERFIGQLLPQQEES